MSGTEDVLKRRYIRGEIQEALNKEFDIANTSPVSFVVTARVSSGKDETVTPAMTKALIARFSL